jgi:hypothetical protein
MYAMFSNAPICEGYERKMRGGSYELISRYSKAQLTFAAGAMASYFVG